MSMEDIAESRSVKKELETLYDVYITGMVRQKEGESISDQFANILVGKRRDPLTEKIAADVDALLQEYATGEPQSGEVREVLEYMFTAHQALDQKHPAHMMILALHRSAKHLIPLLSKEDARDLVTLYDQILTKRERLPVNVDAYKLLKKQAK